MHVRYLHLLGMFSSTLHQSLMLNHVFKSRKENILKWSIHWPFDPPPNSHSQFGQSGRIYILKPLFDTSKVLGLLNFQNEDKNIPIKIKTPLDAQGQILALLFMCFI